MVQKFTVGFRVVVRCQKIDDDVLTCDEDGFITVSSCNGAGQFSSYADEYCIKYPKPKIIAWMPLPKPYTENQKD